MVLSLCVALAATLVLAASAVAAPAGDEYLPKVPAATGHASSAGGGSDLSGSSSGTETGTTESSFGSGTGTDSSQAKDKKDGKKEKVEPAVSTGGGGSSDGGGSSGALIVLLIVAGVIVAAVGMILRRRAGLTDEESGEKASGKRDRDKPSGARPTPDGEIVAGRDNV